MNNLNTGTPFISKACTQISIVGFWERCYAFNYAEEFRRKRVIIDKKTEDYAFSIQ